LIRYPGYRAAAGLALPAVGLIVCLISGANAGSVDRSPLPPDSLADEAALAVVNTAEFDRVAMHAAAFAAVAQREGIAVSSEELKQKVGLYAKLYPGQVVDPEQVRQIALAEKYLEAKGIRPEGSEPDGVSESRLESSRFAAPEDAESAKQAIGLHLLLGREDMQGQAEKLEELAQVRLSSEQKPTAMRSVSELQLQGDPGECLAWTGQDCFLTLQEYNAAAAYYPMPGTMPLETARAIILKRYLPEKRLAATARTLGLDRKADSLLQRVLSRKRDFLWTQSVMAFGAPVRDMRLLEAAYAKYYGQYFAPGEDVTLALIGSSDSAYIDSLHRMLRPGFGKRTSHRKLGRDSAAERVMPWSFFKIRQLPPNLVALAETLKVGQCSSPYHSSFGHFLVRLEKAVPTPEVSFENAFPRVVFLATRDRFLEMDSVAEAQAKRYYATNIGRFARLDTLGLRAWLIPRRAAPSIGMARINGKAPVLADTAGFKAMDLSSLALPPQLRISLQEQVRKDPEKAFFGPLYDRYGRWYFQVRSRKSAHGFLPFRLARKEILDSLGAPPEEEGSGTASEDAQEDAGYNFALAQAYRAAQHQEPLEKDEGKRQAEGDALARFRAQAAEHRAEENRMLKEARVDLNRLSE
jgi:hypothetical protein